MDVPPRFHMATRYFYAAPNHRNPQRRVATKQAHIKAKGDDDGVVRMEGCPVSVAEQVLALVALSGVKNPYLDPANMVGFSRAYLGWKSRVALNRLQFKRYQTNGTFEHRGYAAPESVVPLGPSGVS